MKNTSEKKQKIEKIIKNFAIFNLPENYQELPSEILRFLIKQSFTLSDNSPKTLEETKNSIEELFTLEFEEEEINEEIKILRKNGDIEIIRQKKVDILLYRLSDFCFRETKKLNKENKEKEKNIFKEWIHVLKNKYPAFTEDLCEELIKNLKTFFAKVLLKHGAECARIFYKDLEIEKTLSEVFKKENIVSTLSFKKLGEIQQKEIVKFFLEANQFPERQKYIFDQLNASFIYRIVSIDPDCATLIKSLHFKGDRIFLDNNFLYSLFGLTNGKRQKLAVKIINLLKDFNFNIFITSFTKDEYLASLENYESSLRRSPIPPKELLPSTIGIVEENPISAYWKENVKSGIGVDEFFSIYKNIDDLLQGYNIKIAEIELDFLEKEKDFTEEIEKMKNIIPIKTGNVLKHDSALVFYIRKQKLKNRSNKTFLLTEDHYIPLYEYKINKFNPERSVAIMPFQLLQILRPLIPRITGDFENIFVSSVIQPILRTQKFLPTNIATIILNRLSRYKEHPPEVAVKLLTNTYFTNKIAYQRKKIGEDLTYQLIDMETLRAANKVIQEKEELLKQEKLNKEELISEINELKGFRKEVKRKDMVERPLKWTTAIIGIILLIAVNIVMFINLDKIIPWFDKYFYREVFWVLIIILNIILIILFLGVVLGYSWTIDKLKYIKNEIKELLKKVI